MKKIIYISVIAAIAILSSCNANQPDQNEGTKVERSSGNLNDETQTGEQTQGDLAKHVCNEKCTAGTPSTRGQPLQMW